MSKPYKYEGPLTGNRVTDTPSTPVVPVELARPRRIESGLDLIEWAKGRCAQEGYVPTDANLMMFIREYRNAE